MATCSWEQRRMSKFSLRRTESAASSQAEGEEEKGGTG